ncbi:DsbE family thiol:disulfide interchange protein [Nevskia sp.]|uniref:DsbE family thiol:disulfide interchange protein n=1 Tax=Nevskia sp. TaxID=1929292 RepID=UPI0025DF64BD|nr:DsbE family thiol:disulfide interchange protein [Nevskia sp.]
MRYAIPLLILGVLLAFFAVGLQRDPRVLPSPLIGKAVPAFELPVLALPKAESPPLSMGNAAFAGKPYLVNFFASWCAGCQVEHPYLMQLAKQGGVTIVGVDYKDADDDVRQWLAARGNPYAPILVDLDGRAGIDFGVYGVPETFVVGADGRILHKHVGALTPEAFARDVKPLLGAGS